MQLHGAVIRAWWNLWSDAWLDVGERYAVERGYIEIDDDDHELDADLLDTGIGAGFD